MTCQLCSDCGPPIEGTDRQCPACGRYTRAVIYKIQPRADGVMELNLSYTHRSFLLFLSIRGGETPYDYALLKPETARHMRLLVEMGLLMESPLIGTPRVLLRLTDVGRNIVDQIARVDRVRAG